MEITDEILERYEPKRQPSASGDERGSFLLVKDVFDCLAAFISRTIGSTSGGIGFGWKLLPPCRNAVERKIGLASRSQRN